MFTGIIEGLGKIAAIGTNRLTIEYTLKEISIGDSVAVNGICLTVTKISGDKLEFDFSPETREKTSLQSLLPGSSVNLERALKVGDRLGGHFLSGHVETTGKVIDIIPAETAYIVKFTLPEGMERYVVEKGSIGIDGISLTVAGISGGSFSCAVIPHTYNNTNLKFKKKGDKVNLEPDILAKYVENILNHKKKGVTEEFLKEHGY